jgi:hypothetical protein
MLPVKSTDPGVGFIVSLLLAGLSSLAMFLDAYTAMPPAFRV